MEISTAQLARIDRLLKAERACDQTVSIEPIIYENSAAEGIVGDWDVGHVEVTFVTDGHTCVARFTGGDKPSVMSRVPRWG